ncbi:MAG: ethanolamine utilization protein EutP [Clostridiales bacterium]|nr:ethanolamine utilization protein EutP [Clostridiales bacterium]
MKRRVMIIGPEGSGKSYLAHLLEGSEAPLGKRQDPIYGPRTIDVPAAYLEHRWMAHHLIAMAQNQAACLVLLADTERNRQVYSHGFAKLFSCPTYGVVNLKDHKGENAGFGRAQLVEAGVDKIFVVDFTVGESMQVFLKAIREAVREG